MSRKRKKHLSQKQRKYRRIRRVLLLILLILLAVLGCIVFWEYKTGHTEEKSAGTETQEGQEEAGRGTEDEAQAQEGQDAPDETQPQETDGEEAAAQAEEEAAQAYINKDIQRAENTATQEHHKTNGLAICMYHYIYDKDDPPDEELNANYIEVHALEEEFQYLKDNDYYFPTWEEVRQYVDGELLLPEKSVVLTFDDGAKTFLKYGPDLCEKYQIPITSFLIAKNEGKKKVKTYANEYLTFQSHSYNMHRAGGNIGHGGIFTVMDHDEAVADLQKSIRIAGNGDAFAYPYGDYNDSCVQAVRDAGFKCAVTTENRRADPGDDPLLLPRVRMSHQQSLESFQKLVE